MDYKTKIMTIWKEQRQLYKPVKKGRFIGITKVDSENAEIIGITIREDGFPVFINHKITHQEYQETLHNLELGVVEKEMLDSNFIEMKKYLNHKIGDNMLNSYMDAFEISLTKEELNKPFFISAIEQIRQKESDFLYSKLYKPLCDKKIIDNEAIEIVTNSYSPNEKSYFYYSVKNEKRKLRHQASQSVPVFANLIAERLSLRQAVDNMQPLMPVLNSTLGNNSIGQPIITKGIMKRINSRILPFNEYNENAKNIMSVLSELPPDWFPSNDEEWNSFIDIHVNIGMKIHGGNRDYNKLYKASAGKWSDFKNSIALAWRDLRPPEGATKADMEYIEKAIDLKILNKMARDGEFNKIKATSKDISNSIPLPANISPQSLESWINTMYAPDSSKKTLEYIGMAIDDISHALSSRIVNPCVAWATQHKECIPSRQTQSLSIDIAKSMIFDGRSLTDGLEILRKIKSQYGTLMLSPINDVKKENTENITENILSPESEKIMRDFLANPGDNIEWSEFVPAFVTQNNIACVPLLNTNLLSYEGEFMNHCVGDYHVSLCKQGTERVFSLRRKNKNDEITTLATMAIQFNKSKAFVQCVLGYGNTSNISPDCEIVVKQMKEKIKDINNMGRHYINQLLDNNNKDSYNNEDTIKDEIEINSGYNWRKKENIIKAMEPWGSFISKPWRKKPDDILASPQILDVAKIINPSLSLQKQPSLTSPVL